jgi:hypothetical protein
MTARCRPCRPPEPRTASGARRPPPQDGFEFAEIRRPRRRPIAVGELYQTARRGELWVNDHHPERSGDLVVADKPGTPT